MGLVFAPQIHWSTEQLLCYACCRCVGRWSISVGPLRELMGIFAASRRHYAAAAAAREVHLKPESTSSAPQSDIFPGTGSCRLSRCLLNHVPRRVLSFPFYVPSIPAIPPSTCQSLRLALSRILMLSVLSELTQFFTADAGNVVLTTEREIDCRCVWEIERAFAGFPNTAAEYRLRRALSVLYVKASVYPSVCQSELTGDFARVDLGTALTSRDADLIFLATIPAESCSLTLPFISMAVAWPAAYVMWNLPVLPTAARFQVFFSSQSPGL